jgi:hypothetical protein
LDRSALSAASGAAGGQLRPKRIDELVAAHRPRAIHGEVDEEKTALTPGKPLLDALALDRDRDASAELEPVRRRQGFAKIPARRA